MDAFSDLAFFRLLVKHGSLAATAQEMGVTPSSCSKRLAKLEARLGVRLLQRTTRRIGLTPEGETYLAEGARLLDDMDELEQRVAGAHAQPRGLLRVGATFGFGRRQIAPRVARFAEKYPQVEVQLTLSDRPFNLVEHGYDVVIRFGELPDVRLSARLLAHNHRVLCAAPAYLQAAGEPMAPRDLLQHRCLVLRESDDTFGTWHLYNGAQHQSVKVGGPLSSNDGDCVLNWALSGHGILIRSEWDVAPHLRSGRLRLVMPDWQPAPAPIYAVYPTRSQLSAKVRAFVDFLHAELEPHRDEIVPFSGW